MSKYIAIIELPDRKACNYCHALDCFEDGTGRCPVLDREIVRDGITWNRPADCPLIPVDRVMDRLYGLCQSQGDAGYRAVGILQDELG